MKIADGVEMLEITADVLGKINTINPTLIWDNDTVILIDAGYPRQLPLIREAIEKAGVLLENLSRENLICSHLCLPMEYANTIKWVILPLKR